MEKDELENHMFFIRKEDKKQLEES